VNHGSIVISLSKSYLQVPNNDAAVYTAGADLADGIGSTGVSANSADGILVNSLELRVIDGFAAKVHLSEHVESRLFALISRAGLRGTVKRSDKRPSR